MFSYLKSDDGQDSAPSWSTTFKANGMRRKSGKSITRPSSRRTGLSRAELHLAPSPILNEVC